MIVSEASCGYNLNTNHYFARAIDLMPQSFNSLPRVQSGDVLTADIINKPNEVLEQLEIQRGAGTLLRKSGSGTTIGMLPHDPVIWARLVSSAAGSNNSTLYGWVELLPQLNGGWVDGFLAGTASTATSANAAIEVNGNAKVPTGTLGNAQSGGSTQSSGGTVVELRYSGVCGCWTFNYSACS